MTGHSAGIDDVVESSRHQGSTVLHDEESDVSITGRGRAYGSDAAAAKDAKRPKRMMLEWVMLWVPSVLAFVAEQRSVGKERETLRSPGYAVMGKR